MASTAVASPDQSAAVAHGVNPWLIAASVMLATFMEVLDTAIASVALPYIAGSLSASNVEATWVLTSYLVANAVILPASNWFSLRFGRKRFLITCVIIFTIASFFCGAAPTLGFILIARIVQGAVRVWGGGGAGARPDTRWLADGHLQLAIRVLHQYSSRRARCLHDRPLHQGSRLHHQGTREQV